jgi:transposase
MHLRVSTKRQNGKTYRYVQLVQSYRDSNGTPTQRVLGNLGNLPAQTVDNLKLALRAARDGSSLVVATPSAGLDDPPKVLRNLRYLDVVVMLRLWSALRLDDLLTELLPEADTAASAAQILAVLVVQRCVAPGSKLFAQRWFPDTALPELLSLSEDKFNNTRLHRVLNDLDRVSAQLQNRLPAIYGAQTKGSSAFFVDVTDTWFEGRGCETAERSRTKAGHSNKRSIGIVLVADQNGYPMRWEVVSSKTKDHQAMGKMVGRLSKLEWARHLPFVFDRAMGRASTLRELLGSGLYFLTAASVDTIEAYTTALPHQSFAALELEGSEESKKQDERLVAQLAREMKFEEIDERLFVFEPKPNSTDSQSSPEGVHNSPPRHDKAHSNKKIPNGIVARLRLALQLKRMLDTGHYRSQAALAREMEINGPTLSNILAMQRLAPDIQEQLLQARADVIVSGNRINCVVKEPDHKKQREMLTAVLEALEVADEQQDEQDGERKATLDERAADDTRALSERLRLVAYFNPQMFIEQSLRAAKHLKEIAQHVAQLNEELANAVRSRSEEVTRRRLIRPLEKRDYLDLFDIVLEPITLTTKTGCRLASFRCELQLKTEKWKQRRRYDGFVLLLAHPFLRQPAKELAQLYRDKDVVEKDFQTIKSVVKLRPIYSHTDPKVRAHVTICMLALLLHRALEQRLRRGNIALTARACLETLASCHLNVLRQLPSGKRIYSVTEPTAAQRELLAALGTPELVDQTGACNALTPRFVPT